MEYNLKNIICLIGILIFFSTIQGIAAPIYHNNSSSITAGEELCTDCHKTDAIKTTTHVKETPAVKKPLNSNTKTQGTSVQITAAGGGSDCIRCHNASGGLSRIETWAIKQGVHANLNSGAVNISELSDPIVKACWACHGDGTEPLTHPDRPAYSCENCHNRTPNMSYTNATLIPNLTTRKVFEHIQPPFMEQISSTIISSNADCIGCHDKSKVIDSGYSVAGKVSHYASRTNLVNPSVNCSLCHKNQENASAYWAKKIRHSARSEEDSFCDNCHNTTPAVDLHSQPLVKPSSVHMGFDWQNDDNSEISPLGANEACLSCHGSAHALGYRKCEECHLVNGSPFMLSWQRPDVNDTIPKVSAHTNFSTEINVPDQSAIYPPSSTTFSSCYSYNSATLAGTCHGISYNNRSISGGFYAFRTLSEGRGSPYHNIGTIDRMPETLNCVFCHNQSDTTIRKAWGNATQITGGTHNWYTGNDNSRCLSCHARQGSTVKDFHSANLTKGGETCIECHGTDYPGANPSAVTTLVNISAFNESIHQNINNTPVASLTNDDCWKCHYNRDMSRQNVKKCDQCHRKPWQWHGNAKISSNLSELW